MLDADIPKEQAFYQGAIAALAEHDKAFTILMDRVIALHEEDVHRQALALSRSEWFIFLGEIVLISLFVLTVFRPLYAFLAKKQDSGANPAIGYLRQKSRVWVETN